MGMDEVRGGQTGHCQEGSMVLLVTVVGGVRLYRKHGIEALKEPSRLRHEFSKVVYHGVVDAHLEADAILHVPFDGQQGGHLRQGTQRRRIKALHQPASQQERPGGTTNGKHLGQERVASSKHATPVREVLIHALQSLPRVGLGQEGGKQELLGRKDARDRRQRSVELRGQDVCEITGPIQGQIVVEQRLVGCEQLQDFLAWHCSRTTWSRPRACKELLGNNEVLFPNGRSGLAEPCRKPFAAGEDVAFRKEAVRTMEP